jgi:hypothetical protein
VVPEILQAIQAIASLIAAIFAGLAYVYARRNHTIGKANTDALNGQGRRLEGIARAAGYQQGVIDQAGGVAPGVYPPSPPAAESE